MSNSTINLYVGTKLSVEKNFVVEDITFYLLQFTTITITDFQYIRPQMLDLTIKINKSQAYLTPTSANDIDYCRIQNSDSTKLYFYFVTNKVWKSANTIELTLRLDVLNTYTWNSDYVVDKKTLVTREHKDRFHLYTSTKKDIELGASVSSFSLEKYYTFDIDELFDSPGIIFSTTAPIYIYKKNGELYRILPNNVIASEFRVQNVAPLIPTPYLCFRRYNIISHSYSDALFNLYENEKDDYYVVIPCNSSSIVEFTNYISYGRTMYVYNKFQDYSSLLRDIHLTSEGINPPLFKQGEFKIYDEVDNSFVLIYKNANAIDPSDFNQVNPVDCYLTTKEYTPIKGFTTTTLSISPSDLNGTYIYVKSGAFQIGSDPKQQLGGGALLELIKSGSEFSEINLWTAYRDVVEEFGTEHIIVVVEKRKVWTHINALTLYTNTDKAKYYYSNTRVTGNNLVDVEKYTVESYVDVSSPTYTTYYLSVDNIDRTESTYIKLIDIPYSPVDINYDSSDGTINFGSDWTYNATLELMKLNNLNVKFSNTFNIDDFNPFDPLMIDSFTASDSDLRNDSLESKIYHSDYYRPKFVYDSFSKDFMFEELDVDNVYEGLIRNEYKFNITFVMSRNIVSKFLFIFPLYITKYSNMDFDNCVPVARNNEEVLYTSQYINYIRSGYNYDVKAKQRSEAQMGAGLTASAITSMVGIVGGIASQNYALAITSAIGAGVSIATQSISYAKSLADMESNIAQKLDSAKRQAVNVMNADDIDLLYAYSDNKAKICFYGVSPTMKQSLLDMFYYCGYSTQEQKVPSINTRYWFNFLQCNLVVTHTNNIPSDIVDVIIARFSEGVTFLHRHTTWDIEQVKENYESWILE